MSVAVDIVANTCNPSRFWAGVTAFGRSIGYTRLNDGYGIGTLRAVLDQAFMDVYRVNHGCRLKSYFILNQCLSDDIGGRGGIRTHEWLPIAGFQDRCLQPLGHSSIEKPRYRRRIYARIWPFIGNASYWLNYDTHSLSHCVCLFARASVHSHSAPCSNGLTVLSNRCTVERLHAPMDTDQFTGKALCEEIDKDPHSRKKTTARGKNRMTDSLEQRPLRQNHFQFFGPNRLGT